MKKFSTLEAIVILAAAGSTLGILACASHDGSRNHGTAAPLYAAEARSDDGMVSTGSVESTRAAVRILEEGGNAVDAAVAAAIAIGVSEPGNSGLGGMTYVLVASADGRAVAIDGSSPVPIAADREELKAIKEREESFGYKSASVPTTLAALVHTLENYGTMDLAQVTAPAIEIAREGYELTPAPISWMQGFLPQIRSSAYLRFLALEDGREPGKPGSVYCRPDLGATLERIVAEGADSFYKGSIAHEIVNDMARHGGYVKRADLASVRIRELEALRTRYRGVEILSFPSPGGGPEVVEALNIIETFPGSFLATDSVERLQVMADAHRIAQADRFRTGGSRAFWSPDGPPKLSKEFARQRATLITPGHALPQEKLAPRTRDPTIGEQTTQITVVDRYGNSVALTQTLCELYGNWRATPGLGFPYSACLEYLDYENPLSPIFLRPRAIFPTSMAPTVVREGHSFRMALGGPGSDRVPSTVTTVISNVVDRGMGLRDAVVAPRSFWNSAHEPPRICVEVAGSITPGDAQILRGFGYDDMYILRYPAASLYDYAFFGAVNAVAYDARTGLFTGVADPRRAGFAVGPRVAAQPPTLSSPPP